MPQERLFAAPLAGGLLASPDASIVVAEWRDPGGGQDPPMYIAPLHVHHEDDEVWYVLEGALRVRVGGDHVDVPAGGGVLVPRGTPHTYWNPQPGPTRYLLFMSARLNALIEAIHALPEKKGDTLAATFAEYRSEYLGWP